MRTPFFFGIITVVALCFTANVQPLVLPILSDVSRGSLQSWNGSNIVSSPSDYPVSCFNPYNPRLQHASAEDCSIVIDEIILRYPNPMIAQTWGYSSSVDIDLRQHEVEKWTFGHCIIFVRNLNKQSTDRFSIVDVAATAHRIATQCLIETKYPKGGTADIGSRGGNFYVGIGAPLQLDIINGSALSLS